jgi:CheY-like chemotaxis protein
MHILFLDDQSVRHELVEKYLSAAGHIVLHAFNMEEGIDIVSNFVQPIGLALLDHDLDSFVVDDDGIKYELTGLSFVNKMLEDVPSEKWFHRAIVHSYNPNGAKYMCDTLNKNGIHAKMDNFSGDMLKRVVGELSIQ